MSAANTWRQLLPELQGLPLLPIGRGGDGKAPADPQTGRTLTEWQNAAFTHQQISTACPGVVAVGVRPGPAANGLLAIDIDGATAVAMLQQRDCNPCTAPTWQVRRTTSDDRLKVLWRIPPDLQDHLPLTIAKKTTKPPTGRGAKDGENVATYYGSGQVVILGQHTSSGGHYFWPDAHGPEALTNITPEWWGLVLEISDAQHAPKASTSNGSNWRRLKPCPICGRDERLICSQSRDGLMIRCFHGGTFSPPNLKAGEVIPGSDGQRWAFTKEATCSLGTFSHFKIDEPLQRTAHTPPSAAPTANRTSDPSRAEVQQRSYSELLAAMLAAVIAGDDDEAMTLRAETIARFRRTDAQIEAALFKLHTERETRGKAITPPASLDLSRISGMDWLLEGFIADNDLTLLWGAANSGKTTAALAAAEAVLLGTGLLDHTQPAPRRGVLFIASDSGAAPLYAAMQDMGMADLPEVLQGPEQRFYVWASDPEQGMTAWAADLWGCVQLLHFIKNQQIGLVMIDSCKAVCSGAGLDYTNNLMVTSLLTYFKEVICPHAAVVFLNHDGTARGATAGAKAWKEIPSVVHRITQEEQKDGTKINNRRHWDVTKSRMGPGRQFFYQLSNGTLELCADQEKVGNCLALVVDALCNALRMQGLDSLSRTDLQGRICLAGGPSPKTLDNTLSTATRARHPEICKVSSRRGHYKLAPRIADSLKGCIVNGKEEGEKPVPHYDLSSSRQVPTGTSGSSQEFPGKNHRNSPQRSGSSGSGHVPSRNAFTPYSSASEVQLVEVPPLVGSGADAFADGDDPAWGPRPSDQSAA
jgi:hypothetical protein